MKIHISDVLDINITLFLTLQSNFGIQPCTSSSSYFQKFQTLELCNILHSKRGIQLSRPLLSSFYVGTFIQIILWKYQFCFFFFFAIACVTSPSHSYYVGIPYVILCVYHYTIPVYGIVYSIVNKLIIIITQIVGIRYWGVIKT